MDWLGSHDHPATNLCSGDGCTDWLKPRSHDGHTESGSEITVQSGQELIPLKQKQGNGCCLEVKNKTTAAVHLNYHLQPTDEETRVHTWEMVCLEFRIVSLFRRVSKERWGGFETSLSNLKDPKLI